MPLVVWHGSRLRTHLFAVTGLLRCRCNSVGRPTSTFQPSASLEGVDRSTVCTTFLVLGPSAAAETVVHARHWSVLGTRQNIARRPGGLLPSKVASVAGGSLGCCEPSLQGP